MRQLLANCHSLSHYTSCDDLRKILLHTAIVIVWSGAVFFPAPLGHQVFDHLSPAAHGQRVPTYVTAVVVGRFAAPVLSPPPEVLVVQRVVGVQLLEVVGEVARRGEVSHVDDGVGREQVRVVGVAEHDRHDVDLENLPDLLRRVVATQTVLERQVELVVVVEQDAVAATIVPPGAAVASAAAILMHVDVLRQRRRVDLSSTRRAAVADKPRDEVLLPGGVVARGVVGRFVGRRQPLAGSVHPRHSGRSCVRHRQVEEAL